MTENQAEKFMKQAVIEAEKAEKDDEVPVGAVIVLNGKIISRGRNRSEKTQIPTRHAEIIAIEKACKKLKSRRLDGAELFVTVEPCAMCAGAIANARIKKVYYGAYEHKSGCAKSLYPILEMNGLNHSCESEGGILNEICSELIKSYFRKKRTEKPYNFNKSRNDEK